MGLLTRTLKAIEDAKKQSPRFEEEGFDPELWLHGGTLGDSQYIDKSKLGSATGTPAGAQNFADNVGGEVSPLFMRGEVPRINWQEIAGDIPVRSEGGQKLLTVFLENNPRLGAVVIKGANDSLDNAAKPQDIMVVRDTARLRDPKAKLEDVTANGLYKSIGGLTTTAGLSYLTGRPQQAQAAIDELKAYEQQNTPSKFDLVKDSLRKSLGALNMLGTGIAGIPETLLAESADISATLAYGKEEGDRINQRVRDFIPRSSVERGG